MTPISLASVPRELLQRVAADLAAHFKLGAAPAAAQAWQILNPYSKVLCIRFSDGHWAQRVFVKLPLRPLSGPSPLPAMMRKEFDILRTLDVPGLPDGGAGTVVPLAQYLDMPAMVTLEAPGPTLRKVYDRDARLFTMPDARARLAERVVLCGQWLRSFHERTDAGQGSFDVEELLAYCQIRLDGLARCQDTVLSPSEINGLAGAARALAATIAREGLRIAGRHNDFASHNIIAGADGGIRVLDFTMYDRGIHAFDVSNFWFELEMLKCDPSYSGTFLSRLQSAFLQAYGGMSPEAPEFRLARMRYAINRLFNAASDSRRLRVLSPHWHRTMRRTGAWLRSFATGG